jgi:hypothetical protein
MILLVSVVSLGEDVTPPHIETHMLKFPAPRLPVRPSRIYNILEPPPHLVRAPLVRASFFLVSTFLAAVRRRHHHRHRRWQAALVKAIFPDCAVAW